MSTTRRARADRFGKSTYQKVVPLPAGRRLGRKHVPDIPAGKFKDVPGQGMLSLDDADPERIEYAEETA